MVVLDGSLLYPIEKQAAHPRGGLGGSLGFLRMRSLASTESVSFDRLRDSMPNCYIYCRIFANFYDVGRLQSAARYANSIADMGLT